jgi:hypothetical protein
MRNDDLIFGGTPMEGSKFKALQRAFHKQQMERHEAEEAENNRLRQETVLSQRSGQDTFDETAFDKETDRQRKEFEAYRAKEDAKERSRQEYQNAQTFIRANPRYIPNPNNSNNITAYLKENGLSATPENLQQAMYELEPILELRPEAVRPIKTYTEAELYALPMEDTDPWGINPDASPSLLEICHAKAQENMKLEITQMDGDEQW